jgi:hypothetical protein
MIASSQVIMETNSLAVACLNAGDLARAKDMLFESFRLLTKALSDLPLSSSATFQPTLHKSCTLVFLSMCQDEKQDTATTITERAHVYLHGINMVPSFSQDPAEHLSLCSAVLVFNLALLQHKEGLSNASNAGYSLKKARFLYEKCQLLLASVGVLSSEWTGNATIDLLGMAVLNNLGQICCETADYGPSSDYYKQLIQLIIATSTRQQGTEGVHYGNARLDYFMEKQRSVFLLNAILVGHPPTLAAAA